MVSLSTRSLSVGIGAGALSTALAAISFPGTVLTQLLAPFSLLLTLAAPGIIAYLVFTRSRVLNTRTVTYGIGLSASLLMLLGFFLNLSYRIGGIDPLTPAFAWLSFGALLFALGYGFRYYVPEDSIEITLPVSVRPYLSIALPIAAGVGGLLVRDGGTNVVILLALSAIVLVYAAGAFRPSNKGMLLYCVALALLLHNSLITDALVWGDQGAESRLVYTVLQAGHWNPTTLPSVNKAVMLRVVIHHPMQLLLTGLEIHQIFKIAHPLMFAITPVSIYHTFSDRGRASAGYLAAGAFVMFFPFITVLSRNTRTAAAIMFIVLFLQALLDSRIQPKTRRALLSIFGISVFVSHYGTGYMFLAMLIAGFVLTQIVQRIFHRAEPRHQQLPGIPLLVIVLVSIAWYTYIPPGSATLRTLASFIVRLFQKLQEGFFQPSSSATANYATESYSSLSLTSIRILTIVLFALIGIGWVAAAIQAWRGEDVVESNIGYLGITAVAGALVVVTFLPVARFNTARTTAIVLAVVAPLFAIGVHSGLGFALRGRSFPDWVTPIICLLILIPFFVFSTGLFAATVTHDYSPNVLVYQDDVVEDGSSSANSYLFKQHVPKTEAHGARWLNDYATTDIFGSQWPGTPNSNSLSERTKATDYTYTGNVSAASPADCIYFDPLSERAGVVLIPSGPLEDTFLSTSKVNTSTRSQVYTNGGSSLYC